MIVRDEQPVDEEAIRAVTDAAFRDAPHSNQTEVAIIAALRDAGALTLSLVATDEKTDIVGHIAFSPVAVDGSHDGWFGIGPVSVIPQRQRQGIGSRLINQGLDRLRAMGAMGCVVLGDPAYYGRFGFAVDAALVFPGVPAAYFQALPFGTSAAVGVVSYHAGFDAH
nr:MULTISPECIES: N-acetyltransferase [unclassified Bradyrhizobium]